MVNDDMFNSASGVEDALYGIGHVDGNKGYVWTADVHDDTEILAQISLRLISTCLIWGVSSTSGVKRKYV
ncbi:MAG: hypothetical protein ACLU4N_11165 [Butyricimonas faecihominis]